MAAFSDKEGGLKAYLSDVDDCNRRLAIGSVDSTINDFDFCLYDISELCVYFRKLSEKPMPSSTTPSNDVHVMDPALVEKCKQMTRSCSTLGFLAITSSSLLTTTSTTTYAYSDGSSVVENVFSHMKTFFKSSLETKRAAYSKSRSTRGFADSESENFATLIGDKKPNDRVEKFRIGPLRDRGSISNSIPISLSGVTSNQTGFEQKPEEYFSCKEGRVHFFPNNWPEGSGFDNFERDVSTYYSMMTDLALAVLHILEIGLDLPLNYFVSQMQHHTSILGLNYYPVLQNDIYKDSTSSSSDIRVAGHTDVSMLTIVSQRIADIAIGGLEILPRQSNMGEGISGGMRSDDIIAAANTEDRKWMKIPYNDRSFVINIGDCLQDWTKGRLMSTLHRVTMKHPELNCEATESSSIDDRYSIAFFVSPEYDAKLCWPVASSLLKATGSDSNTSGRSTSSSSSSCGGSLNDSETSICYSEWRRRRIHRAQVSLKQKK